MIDTSLFPHQNHPYRLEFGEKKNPTICFFECEQHLNKYIERYKLKAKELTIQYRDEKPTRTSKTNKKKLQQGTAKSSDGGTSRSRRNTKDLDACGTVSRTRKSKPKSK
jgi:hypothetical protein